MTTVSKKPKESKELIVPKLTYSERFTNMVIQEFASNAGEIELTSFQKKLCQNYFIVLDSTLKEAESRRMQKGEQYRDALAYTWENVNMQKLAVNVIAYSSVGLDPIQPNHISLVPYKNPSTNKYDFTFIIGYKGTEIKAVKYGLDVPSSVTVELVRKNDAFKEMKKDIKTPVENYVFEITDSFNRGEIIGGFYFHNFSKNSEKNKIKTFTLADIEKRKPKSAPVEFWGGEKDEWKNGQKTGNKIEIEGWFEEMAYKTIYKAAYNAITIDSQKIDEHYLAIIQNERDFTSEKIQSEITEKANKEPLSIDIDSEEVVEDEKQYSIEEAIEEVVETVTSGPQF